MTVAVFIVLASRPAPAQMIDLNGNGMSDVWEQIYGASALSPNADADGDGVSNLKEALASTNPNDSNSYPRITAIGTTATNFSTTFPSAPGKVYQLQSLTNLGGTNWTVETHLVVRVGTNLTLLALSAATGKFFRIAISDTNTDGSGAMNDWEKYQLGLDPFNPISNNQLDGNGNLLTDYAYATNKLAAQNIFTIAATDPVTVEPDPGSAATDLGGLTVTRGGFPLNAVTVNLGLGGPGAGFATAGIDHSNLPTSIAFPVGTSAKTISVTPLANTNLQVPVIAQLKLLAGTGYTLGSASNASVVIYPSATSKGTGLTGYYYTNASATYTNGINFNPTNFMFARLDPAVSFAWGTASGPFTNSGYYHVRWVGQVQPQYSETYYFVVTNSDGCKLWVNDQLIVDDWKTQSAVGTVGSIALQAGTRYNLKLDFFRQTGSGTANLAWYSADQSLQTIPSSRLYPTNNFGSAGISNAPATITSALAAFGFVGQPFSFAVTAANSPTNFTATNLPPGLALTATNGLISGVPTLAGEWQMPLTASNAVGVGASVLDITIFNTGSAVSREVWTNLPGTNIADIPVDTVAANVTGAFTALEGITNFGDNYGERVRGYFTAPATANYYFWIAGSDAAQLWISDDSEPANKILRCWVTPTNNPTVSGQNGTSPRQWNLQSSQRSGWLALNAGQKYYLEVLHKAGVGTNDNWSVAWLPDPTGTNTVPAGVTPNYFLSRYFTPPAATLAGTLYTANLLAPAGVISTGVGSATMRLSADGSQAIISFQLNNLVGTPSAESIDTDTYLTHSSIKDIFDISVAHPQADGTYVWNIKATSGLTVADIDEIILEGKSLINIGTTYVPGGEVSGHFTLANGAQNFAAPPAPPAWTDDSATTNGAVRFLTQATFGASPTDIAAVLSGGFTNWINNQLALPATHYLGIVQTNRNPDPSNIFPSSDWFNSWWQNAVTAPDQLRQRVAFALSEILVASESGTLQDHSDALAFYYDTLLDNAFGNYRALLKAVTLTPAMGVYLNMQANSKGSLVNGTHANENYAREINQLFSIGLNRLWPDGSLVLNSSGNLVPTYTQPVVSGFAAMFTGWNYYQTNQLNGRLPASYPSAINYTNPMVLVPSQHDLNAKLALDNVTLPPAWGNQTVASTTNDAYCSQDLEQALDSIYNHPNVGPFICRQLIQRLVTSNPSRGYLYRVVQKFNDNGNGVRGDMAAVVKAILLDYEARSTDLLAVTTYGKQREPLLRVTATARAFPAPANQAATYVETGTQTISITTPAPHRLNNSDVIALSFADTSGNPAPPSTNYVVSSVTGSNSFTIACPNLLAGSYVQTNNTITVTISGHGLVTGNAVYLVFTSGGAPSGPYAVTFISGNVFTVTAFDSVSRSGSCLLPRITASGFVQSSTNITVSCAGPHGLVVNQTIFIPASTYLVSGQYQVASIPDATHFTYNATNSASQTQSTFNLYPLGAPPLTRNGNATVQWSTWKMGYTDSDPTYNLAQSPLSANTVFNFFFPNYQFPGTLAAAGLTTPEFQLTSDTGVALQMNFLESGVLTNSSSNANSQNTNGLSSFTTGNGAIVLDLGPWLTTNYAANANVPALVDNFNSRLLAGQLSAAAKTNIINYVTNTVNFPYGTPPTATQLRDRVRAVVHLLICSPDFTIQK